MTARRCSVEGCQHGHQARGLCSNHYAKARRAGRLSPLTADDRFWGHVTKGSDGCWRWDGGPMSSGYSQFYDRGRTWLGHRWAYERFVGPIPDGLVLDHLCSNRLCVNPSHLEAVTDYENRRRGRRSPEATHCVNGHLRAGENVYIDPRGHKGCRTCRREQQRACQSRRRSA